MEKALNLPLFSNSKKVTCNGETHTLSEWAKISGVHSETIRHRIKKGWPVEDAIFKKTKKEKQNNDA